MVDSTPLKGTQTYLKPMWAPSPEGFVCDAPCPRVFHEPLEVRADTLLFLEFGGERVTLEERSQAKVAMFTSTTNTLQFELGDSGGRRLYVLF